MAIDYTALSTLAKTLIDDTLDAGREVTFIRFDQTPAAAASPHEGPTDPRATPDATATVNAVFVPLSSLQQLGLSTIDEDLLKRTAEVAIVAPGPALAFDLATANEMIDGTVYKKLTFTETLKPASVTLLYFIGIAR